MDFAFLDPEDISAARLAFIGIQTSEIQT